MTHNDALSSTESDSHDLYANSKSNVAILTIAQALSGANAMVVYATGAIVGNTLSPSQALATLPITIFVAIRQPLSRVR